jgi:hypothetical protein
MSKTLHREQAPVTLTRVNPFFSNEKPGRRTQCSTSGDFGKFISKSLEPAAPSHSETEDAFSKFTLTKAPRT